MEDRSRIVESMTLSLVLARPMNHRINGTMSKAETDRTAKLQRSGFRSCRRLSSASSINRVGWYFSMTRKSTAGERLEAKIGRCTKDSMGAPEHSLRLNFSQGVTLTYTSGCVIIQTCNLVLFGSILLRAFSLQ